MKIFSWILKLQNKTDQSSEKRLQNRFMIPVKYPLKANVLSKNNTKRKLYLNDISVFGIGGQIKAKLDGFSLNDQINLNLEFENRELDFKATIVYLNEQGQLGLDILTPTGVEATSFFQLMSPIRIGQSFVEMKEEDINQNDQKYKKRVFTSTQGAFITIWTDSDCLKFFEFSMEDFVLRKNENGKIGIYSFEGKDFDDYKKFHRSEILNELSLESEKAKEIQQVFDLIKLNMSESVPEDIVKFLEPIS